MAEINVERELANIPPEFQEVFRNAVSEEMSLAGLTTDPEKLAFLRQKEDEIRGGAFIRPDGRAGLVTLSPDEKYDDLALNQMTQDFEANTEEKEKERRGNILKVVGLVVIALLFVAFAFSGQGADEEVDALEPGGTPASDAIVNDSDNGSPTATSGPLPETLGNADTLQLVGGSGGSLTIGRPAAIELHYSATEEVVALAIDPSQTTNRGELQYQEDIMLSDNPLAVWLFGTVLNYGIGIPDNMVRQLEEGDLIVLNTDTGASLRFIVTETGIKPNYATTDILSQGRTGMTLFALPAVSEERVAVAFAAYDMAQETIDLEPSWEISDTIPLNNMELSINWIKFSQTLEGQLSITVEGTAGGENGRNTVLLSLSSRFEQTESNELSLTGETATWSSSFLMSPDVQGANLLAEIRVFPGGVVETVHLGEVPHLVDGLQVMILDPLWDTEKGEATLRLSFHNDGEGTIRIAPDYLQVTSEGGDVPIVTNLALPILIEPKGTTILEVLFVPTVPQNVHLRVGINLWEIVGFPEIAL